VPRRILDIGSGTGDLLAALRDEYPEAELRGIELSRAGIESARRKVPDADFLQRDLTLAEPPPPEYEGWGPTPCARRCSSTSTTHAGCSR